MCAVNLFLQANPGSADSARPAPRRKAQSGRRGGVDCSPLLELKIPGNQSEDPLGRAHRGMRRTGASGNHNKASLYIKNRNFSKRNTKNQKCIYTM